jgi:hypothetical protein
MSTAPYQRSYRRVQPKRHTYAGGYVANSAAYLTDHGADPEPRDLAWCIRRRWRVIYYSARYAARQPLWQGAEDFEASMAQVLRLLSSGFEPIPPLRVTTPNRTENDAADGRKDRVYQLSCRLYRAPTFDLRDWAR